MYIYPLMKNFQNISSLQYHETMGSMNHIKVKCLHLTKTSLVSEHTHMVCVRILY